MGSSWGCSPGAELYRPYRGGTVGIIATFDKSIEFNPHPSGALVKKNETACTLNSYRHLLCICWLQPGRPQLLFRGGTWRKTFLRSHSFTRQFHQLRQLP